jgi:hypothetical protein
LRLSISRAIGRGTAWIFARQPLLAPSEDLADLVHNSKKTIVRIGILTLARQESRELQLAFTRFSERIKRIGHAPRLPRQKVVHLRNQ